MKLRLAFAAVALGATLVAGGSSFAQGDPQNPAITSTYTIDTTNQRVVINVIKRDEIPNGDPTVTDFDITFGDAPWLPPVSTPPTDFRSPPDWRWEPIPPSIGWRVVNPTGWNGTNTQFEVPYRGNPPTGAIEMKATGFGDQHRPVYNFVSTPPDTSAAGAVPSHYELPSESVGAAGFFEGLAPTCGRPSAFEDEFVLSTNGRGALTLRQPRTGDVVTGRVARNGAFRLVGETEVYVGAVNGTRFAATYEYTSSGCTSAYLARLTLEQAGRFVPACTRPTIVAPARAVVRAARVPLRIGTTCAGSRLSRWPIEVTLRDRGRTFRVGTFRTTLAPRNVVVRLGDTRPREIVLTAKAGQGLRAATKRVRLVYGR